MPTDATVIRLVMMTEKNEPATFFRHTNLFYPALRTIMRFLRGERGGKFFPKLEKRVNWVPIASTIHS